MIIVVGIVAFVLIKMTMSGTQTGTARQGNSISGKTGTTINVSSGGSARQGPASGVSGGAGNANQPWYTGALIAGSATAAKDIVGGIESLFSSSSSDDASSTILADSDLSAAQSDMGDSSYSSTDDSEDPSLDSSSSEEYA